MVGHAVLSRVTTTTLILPLTTFFRWIAWVLCLFGSFQHPLSVAYLAATLGVFVQGIGAYSGAALFEPSGQPLYSFERTVCSTKKIVIVIVVAVGLPYLLQVWFANPTSTNRSSNQLILTIWRTSIDGNCGSASSEATVAMPTPPTQS